jgi:hypothetical protein
MYTIHITISTLHHPPLPFPHDPPEAAVQMARLRAVMGMCGTVEDCVRLVREEDVLAEVVGVLGGVGVGVGKASGGAVLNLALDVLLKLGRNVFSEFVIDFDEAWDEFRGVMTKANGYAVLLGLFRNDVLSTCQEKIAVILAKFNHGRLIEKDAMCIVAVPIRGLTVCEFKDDVRIDNLLCALVSLCYFRNPSGADEKSFKMMLTKQGIVQLVFRFVTHPKYTIVRSSGVVFNNVCESDARKDISRSGVLSELVRVLGSVGDSSFAAIPSSLDLVSVTQPTAVSHSMCIEVFCRGLANLTYADASGEIRGAAAAAGLVPVLEKVLQTASRHCALCEDPPRPAVGGLEKSTAEILEAVNYVLGNFGRVDDLVDKVVTSNLVAAEMRLLNKFTMLIENKRNGECEDSLVSSMSYLLYQIAKSGFDYPTAAGLNSRRTAMEAAGGLTALVSAVDALCTYPAADLSWTLTVALDYLVGTVCALLRGTRLSPAQKYVHVLQRAKSVVRKGWDEDMNLFWSKLVDAEELLKESEK